MKAKDEMESLEKMLEKYGYNSEKKTYTPWYGIPMNIKFSNSIESNGSFIPILRKITISQNENLFDQIRRTFYHEKIHADIFPIEFSALFFGMTGIFSSFQQLDNSLARGILTCASMLVYKKGIDLLSEAITYTSEFKKFGPREDPEITKEVLTALKNYI